MLLLLAASAALYALGTARLWRRAGRGRGVSLAAAACFGAGWAVLAAALASPLDRAAEASFTAHMVQHELLMAIAAPLLVLGRPLEAWSWSLPHVWRVPVANALGAPTISRVWAIACEPVVAWTLHAVAIWAWHVPALFEAALRDPGVHTLQHASFLVTALFFWWAVFGGALRRADGRSVASLFTTMMHSGALGALLTFAPTVWYEHYRLLEGGMLTPLEDQQLGGLVMWGPGGLAYLLAALALVGAWLRRRPARGLR
jgi:cytochrome c oxidase assembly factor CtaG